MMHCKVQGKGVFGFVSHDGGQAVQQESYTCFGGQKCAAIKK